MANTPTPGSALCDCSDPGPKAALILYPSLGMPLLLSPDQKKCSIFIVTTSLGMPNLKGGKTTLDKRAVVTPMDGDEEKSAAATVARHLRLVDMRGPKPDTDIKLGGLTGDGKDCAKAMGAIKVWQVAQFQPGKIIYNQKGEVFATVSHQAVAAYSAAGFAGGTVYEVELELAQLAVRPESGRFKSFAWMVAPTESQRKDFPVLCKGQTVHAQDLLVEKFLSMQVEDPRNRHKAGPASRAGKQAGLLEYDVEATANNARTLRNGSEPLAAWHPVIHLSGTAPLKLGHLSDVHINVRHNALAKSQAKVIEDDSFDKPPVGQLVCNSFNALKALFDEISKSGKPDTALLFTGDLQDFNRNIDPTQVPDGLNSIGSQWKKFNVLNNINTPGLYPRGQDDLLAYSLVRYAYNKLMLPVFMTSGNHEAYTVPYGISPRINDWGAAMGVLESTTNTLNKDTWGRERPFKPSHTIQTDSGPEQVSAINPIAEVGRMVVNKNKHTQIKDLENTYRDLDSASQWADPLANGGIARDHNMTVYEACLAYGPTYAQALTGENFNPKNFDWFYVLFTPLSDYVLAWGCESDDPACSKARQVVAALGWGNSEQFKNITGALVQGNDEQGAGILPRAVESFSEAQLAVIDQAQRYKQASKSTLTVATHFTIVSYRETLGYADTERPEYMDKLTFVPAPDVSHVVGGPTAFNLVNSGTCEKNQRAYFDACVRPRASAAALKSTLPAVDWHLSGHSHRAGVYSVERMRRTATFRNTAIEQPPGMRVVESKDPGLHGTQSAPPNSHTRFVVVSSGGVIGYQNLDGELSAMTGRPPAANLMDCTSGAIQQIATRRSVKSAGAPFNEKPRLSVALDYLELFSRRNDADEIKKGREARVDSPFRLEAGPLLRNGARVTVVLSEQMKKLACISGVQVWVFEKDDKSGVRKWNLLKPTLLQRSGQNVLVFNGPDLVTLNRCAIQNGEAVWNVTKAFCEVLLKTPTVAKGQPDWTSDMVCGEADSWVYPLEIMAMGGATAAASSWSMRRPDKELGEVADWDWLASMYSDKGYIPAKQAIERKGA